MQINIIRNSNTKVRSKKVRMKDIAKEAGVSISTVSLVFNNKPGISDEVRDRVKSIAKSLGYEPKTEPSPNQTDNYLIIIPPSVDNVMQDKARGEIYDKYLDGFEEAAQELDVSITYIPSIGNIMGNLFIRLLENELTKCKGAVFCSLGRLDNEIFTFLQNSGLPVILLNRIVNESHISYVSVDYYSATYHMVTELIKKGCKKIMYVENQPKLEILNTVRLKAYQRALKDNGIEIDENLICRNKDTDSITSLISEYYNPISKDLGIYGNANYSILMLKKVLTPMGLQMGKNLKIAGGEYLENYEGIDFNLVDAVQFSYSKAAYYALKALDLLATNPHLGTVRMLLNWEYLPAKLS